MVPRSRLPSVHVREEDRMARQSTSRGPHGHRFSPPGSPALRGSTLGSFSCRGYPRAPGCVGRKEGATPPLPWPVVVRERERQEPPGPAAETKTTRGLVDCRRRRRGLRAHGRGPMWPREAPSAPWSCAPEATALDAVWTSRPTEGVGDGGRAALGAGSRCGMRRRWLLVRSPAVAPAVSLPLGNHNV
jgi:hypothetical protein